MRVPHFLEIMSSGDGRRPEAGADARPPHSHAILTHELGPLGAQPGERVSGRADTQARSLGYARVISCQDGGLGDDCGRLEPARFDRSLDDK